MHTFESPGFTHAEYAPRLADELVAVSAAIGRLVTNESRASYRLILDIPDYVANGPKSELEDSASGLVEAIVDRNPRAQFAHVDRVMAVADVPVGTIRTFHTDIIGSVLDLPNASIIRPKLVSRERDFLAVNGPATEAIVGTVSERVDNVTHYDHSVLDIVKPSIAQISRHVQEVLGGIETVVMGAEGQFVRGHQDGSIMPEGEYALMQYEEGVRYRMHPRTIHRQIYDVPVGRTLLTTDAPVSRV